MTERLQELVHEFASAAHQMLLFTRHVRKVSVLVVEPAQESAKLLGEVRRCSPYLDAYRRQTQSGSDNSSGLSDSASDCFQVFAKARTLDSTPALRGTATELIVARNVPADGGESCDKWLKVVVFDAQRTGRINLSARRTAEA